MLRNAVLHFAVGSGPFSAMVRESERVRLCEVFFGREIRFTAISMYISKMGKV